jgi:hypothetical protein
VQWQASSSRGFLSACFVRSCLGMLQIVDHAANEVLHECDYGSVGVTELSECLCRAVVLRACCCLCYSMLCCVDNSSGGGDIMDCLSGSAMWLLIIVSSCLVSHGLLRIRASVRHQPQSTTCVRHHLIATAVARLYGLQPL